MSSEIHSFIEGLFFSDIKFNAKFKTKLTDPCLITILEIRLLRKTKQNLSSLTCTAI